MRDLKFYAVVRKDRVGIGQQISTYPEIHRALEAAVDAATAEDGKLHSVHEIALHRNKINEMKIEMISGQFLLVRKQVIEGK